MIIEKSIGNSRNFSSHVSLGEIEATLRIAERQALASEDILRNFEDGESYETLQRQVYGFHINCLELSKSIKQILPEN